MYDLDLLTPPVILLCAGFFVILISRFMRVSPIVGFLLAGLVLGPHGLSLIEDTETTKLLAKLGVVFLLFDIGLHFSMKSAWSLRRDLFGLAPLQVFLTSIIVAFTLNVIFSLPPAYALLAGVALSLSSTAVVMQIIGDLKHHESPVGQTAKSVLIFQDIVAIFLLIFADAVGGGGSLFQTFGLALVNTVLAFIAAIAIGQYVLSPLLRTITKYNDPELFTVLGLGIVMVTALATAYAGLSLTLGAFLAGMVLAETPFRVVFQNELRPFRSLLMAFFFITVGMMIPPALLIENGDVILGLVALLISVKAVILGALLFIFKKPAQKTVQLTFLLAQGSEFAFVVFSMAAIKADIGFALTQQLIAAIAITMLLTPFLAAAAHRWSLKLIEGEDTITNCPQGRKNPVGRDPVFIMGMNEVGKTLARACLTHNIPYIAIDHDHNRFLEATSAGYIMAFGDPSDIRFWNTLGVAQARAICITAPRLERAKTLTPLMKKLYPDLKRYVAVDDSADGVRFSALGMIPFHNRGAPPGLEMAGHLLREFGVDPDTIERWSEEEQSAWLDVQPDLIKHDMAVNQTPLSSTAGPASK